MSRLRTRAWCARRNQLVPFGLISGLLLTVSCGGDDSLPRPTTDMDGGAADPEAGLSETDAGSNPLSLSSLEPPHGPAAGGNAVLIVGDGFTEETRVTVVGVEVIGVRVLSSRRLRMTMPAGAPGRVDVVVRNAAGPSASLPYTYENLVVNPTRGSSRGGLRVTVEGAAASFTAGDEVLFDDARCVDVEVTSENEITCLTPAHAAGTVDVIVRGGGAEKERATAAFTFEEWRPSIAAAHGFPIDGAIDVIVLANGRALEGATVQLGEDPATALKALTNSEGRATIRGEGLRGPVNVHAAHPCTYRASMIGVDASEVQLVVHGFRDREEDDRCPRSVAIPGGVFPGATATGLLVWYGGEIDAPIALWHNVPPPREGEERVAYVMAEAPDTINENPDFPYLDRVTEDDLAGDGYAFQVALEAGVRRFIAIAGLERPRVGDEGPFTPDFTAYVVGMSDPVSALAEETTSGVVVPMVAPLTRSVALTVEPPPGGAVQGAHEDFEQHEVGPTGTFGNDFAGTLYGRVATPRDLLGFQEEWGKFEGDLATNQIRIMALPEPIGAFAEFDLLAAIEWERTGRTATVRADARELVVADFLPIPQIEAPPMDARFENGGRITFRADAHVDLGTIEVRPVDSAVPSWDFYVRGDLREIRIPQGPEFALLSERHRIEVEILRAPGFDFRHFNMDDIGADAGAFNLVFACIGSPCPEQPTFPRGEE